MSFVSIRARIVEVMTNLYPSPIATIYNGEQNPNGVEIPVYPAAEIVRLQTNPEYLTNREDIEGYVFAINIYQKVEADNFHTVEIAGDALVDAVLTAFIQNANLTGTANARVRPIAAASGVTSWMGVMCRRDTVFLDCRKILSMDA